MIKILINPTNKGKLYWKQYESKIIQPYINPEHPRKFSLPLRQCLLQNKKNNVLEQTPQKKPFQYLQ